MHIALVQFWKQITVKFSVIYRDTGHERWSCQNIMMHSLYAIIIETMDLSIDRHTCLTLKVCAAKDMLFHITGHLRRHRQTISLSG
jgi:hypothetical protein